MPAHHHGSSRRSFPGTRAVLIVDDEPLVLSTLKLWLEQNGLVAVCAQTIGDAIRAARRSDVAVAVVDYRLAEGDEGVRLGVALRQSFRLPFLLISGYLDVTIAVEAMKAGADDVIAKPLKVDRFLSAVERALLTKRGNLSWQTSGVMLPHAIQSFEPAGLRLLPAASRWARMVLAACHAGEDPRTVLLWSEAVAMSTSTIEETCHLCHVSTHESRDLARFLRALALNRHLRTPLRDQFAVADQRTLDHLFLRAGLPLNASEVSLREFLTKQRFISTSAPCLQELAHLAANSPLFS